MFFTGGNFKCANSILKNVVVMLLVLQVTKSLVILFVPIKCKKKLHDTV